LRKRRGLISSWESSVACNLLYIHIYDYPNDCGWHYMSREEGKQGEVRDRAPSTGIVHPPQPKKDM
jgi:hypothetical protein